MNICATSVSRIFLCCVILMLFEPYLSRIVLAVFNLRDDAELVYSGDSTAVVYLSTSCVSKLITTCKQNRRW